MFPLIAAVELLARDFVLAADGWCEFPSKHKKILHTAFKLCSDVYSDLIFLASALLFPLLNVLSCQESAVISTPFPSFLSSLTGTGYWMKENLHESKGLWRIQAQPAGHICLVFARGTVVVSKSSRSVPRLLGWVWGLKPTGQSTSGRKVLTWVQAPWLSHKNVRTN